MIRSSGVLQRSLLVLQRPAGRGMSERFVVMEGAQAKKMSVRILHAGKSNLIRELEIMRHSIGEKDYNRKIFTSGELSGGGHLLRQQLFS